MIDLQGLERVYQAAQNEPNFKMSAWKCGTSHCMIGAFCTQNQDDILQLRVAAYDEHTPRIIYTYPYLTTNPFIETIKAITTRFGITPTEVQWLFTNDRVIIYNKKQALHRLRVFIEHKRRHQLLVHTLGRNEYILDRAKNLGSVWSIALESTAT